MKRFCVILLYALFSLSAFSQSLPGKHPSTLGIQASQYNFQKYSLLKDFSYLNPGLAALYIKGLSNHVDLQADFTGSFPDSTAKNDVIGNESLLLQAALGTRLRLNSSANAFQPFLFTGAGISNHNRNLAGFIAAGPGIEERYQNIYFLINVRYHLSISNSLNHHVSYSIGISGLLSKPKRQKPRLALIKAVQPAKPPDTDNDGTVDSIDRCPALPGLARFFGCPDTDGDGIPDYADLCPTAFGYEKYKGCPLPDRDQDGIIDEADQCPNLPGTMRYRGCPVPDSDGDGINDEEDSCVTVAGLLTNHGCPVVSKEMTSQINMVASNIFFKTGSFQLLSKSFIALNGLAHLLTENKTISLAIEGHTDNAGTETSNQLLSEYRAKTVANYLSTRGVEKSRLSAVGFGTQKPVATNNTEEGRAKNRRVELKAN